MVPFMHGNDTNKNLQNEKNYGKIFIVSRVMNF